MFTLISVLFRFGRRDLRFIGFLIRLIRGRPGFNFMPTARVAMLLGLSETFFGGSSDVATY